MEIVVTYTFPRPPEAEEAERELARLDTLDNLPDDIEERRQSLLEQIPPTEHIRITVGTCNVLEHARYGEYQREVWDWFKEKTGVSIDEVTDGQEFNIDEMTWKIMDVGMHRAYMLASLRRVEVMRASYGDEDEDWKEAELPEEWQTIEGFAQNVPAALFERWADAARRCNPGLFWVDMSDEGKGSGDASVTVSTIGYGN